MINVTFWNPEKISSRYKEKEGERTYTQMRNLEKLTGNSYSSTIQVTDIEQAKEILNTVLNETDMTLMYQVVKRHYFFRTEWDSLEEAEANGAVYEMEMPEGIDDSFIQDFTDFITDDVLGLGYEVKHESR